MRIWALLLVGLWLPLGALLGARFPEVATVDGTPLTKLGEHRSSYKRLLPLYDIALFVEAGASAAQVQARNCAFQIQFHYLRTIRKDTILRSADHVLRNNLSAAERQSIAAPSQQLHAHYRTVQRGDRAALTYRPGHGTTFSFNAAPLITLPQPAFAEHYLKIWLGERPISVKLRDDLLDR